MPSESVTGSVCPTGKQRAGELAQPVELVPYVINLMPDVGSNPTFDTLFRSPQVPFLFSVIIT